MSKVSYVMIGDAAVIVIDSQTHNIGPDHPNHGVVIEALREEEFEGLLDLINLEKAIVAFSRGHLTVTDGEVLYGDDPLHSSLQTRLLDMIDQGFNVEPLVAFIENLMDNPSHQATEELYLFMEANNLPITSDGHFLAYKNVNGEYKDIHSGTFDNSIGSVCEMPRNKVQDKRDVTCSTGLHFCGLSYLKSFGGEHTMILKINPRDVVSIPRDYNNAKGRTCSYEVVGEHIHEDRFNTPAFDRAVQDEAGVDERRVVCVDRDDDLALEYYDNLDAAAADMDCPASYIRRVLVGDREATQGHRWFYEDEWQDYCDEVDALQE